MWVLTAGDTGLAGGLFVPGGFVVPYRQIQWLQFSRFDWRLNQRLRVIVLLILLVLITTATILFHSDEKVIAARRNQAILANSRLLIVDLADQIESLCVAEVIVVLLALRRLAPIPLPLLPLLDLLDLAVDDLDRLLVLDHALLLFVYAAYFLEI